MQCSTRRVFVWVVVVFALSFPAFGQNTGELRGTVQDAIGAPVVSAFVMVEGRETALIRAATTDDAGAFIIPSLPVGLYRIQVKADGFSTLDIAGSRISIGQVVTLNLRLTPGSGVSERAEAASVLETGDTQLGVVMTDSIVSALPLKSRDGFDLLQLQPGVQSTVGADLFYGGDRPGVVSVNGGRARSNDYKVNGGHSSDQFVNAPTIQPSPDTIAEFRVISHNYDAELGRNSGSVLNVITKSGNNALHGTAYEYFRNRVLNSKGYFDPQKPDFKQNEFGGTLGGAVQKDRSFFFVSYEGRRMRRGITSDTVAVPTLLERQGDFSAGSPFSGVLTDAAVAEALNSRSGCASAIASRGGSPIAAGTSYADIFPGNVIPAECFDRTAADLLQQFVPLANAGSVYLSSAGSVVRKDQVTARLDHQINSAQQLSFFYYGVGLLGTAAVRRQHVPYESVLQHPLPCAGRHSQTEPFPRVLESRSGLGG